MRNFWESRDAIWELCAVLEWEEIVSAWFVRRVFNVRDNP